MCVCECVRACVCVCVYVCVCECVRYGDVHAIGLFVRGFVQESGVRGKCQGMGITLCVCMQDCVHALLFEIRKQGGCSMAVFGAAVPAFSINAGTFKTGMLYNECARTKKHALASFIDDLQSACTVLHTPARTHIYTHTRTHTCTHKCKLAHTGHPLVPRSLVGCVLPSPAPQAGCADDGR